MCFAGQLSVNLMPNGVTVVEFGESLNISCTSTSNIETESVYFTWTFNGEIINDTSPVITLMYDSGDSVELAGIYQCFAATKDVLVSGTSNSILVVFAPAIIEHPSSVSVSENGSVELFCEASGYPSPVIEWYRVEDNNNTSTFERVLSYSIELPDSAYNETTESSRSTNSTLIIDNIQYDDNGYYLCVATLVNDSIEFTGSCCGQNSNVDSNNVDSIHIVSTTSTLSGMK